VPTDDVETLIAPSHALADILARWSQDLTRQIGHVLELVRGHAVRQSGHPRTIDEQLALLFPQGRP
jgi:hypothetical protein